MSAAVTRTTPPLVLVRVLNPVLDELEQAVRQSGLSVISLKPVVERHDGAVPGGLA